MPQFTSFVIKDGSTTPADVTYSPETLATDNTVLVDRRQNSRSNQPFLKNQFSAPTAGRASYKIRRLYNTPIIEDVNGVTVQSGVIRTEVTHTIPQQSTPQVRKHHAAFVANGESHPQVRGQIEILETWY